MITGAGDTYAISVVDTSPELIAVVRVTTTLSQWPRQFAHELNKVYAAIKAGHVPQNGHNIMVYRPRQDGRVDIECGVQTDTRFESIGEVACSETPSGLTVTTAHTGPYEQLGTSHSALVNWSRANGHRLTGICWEVYGDWNEDTSKLRTDIFHLACR